MLRASIVIIFGATIFLNCKREISRSTQVFIGGEIINPASDSVLLYLGEFPIDTLLLNEENKFEKRFDSLYSGIYQLDLLVDSQDILLEPGDSLWIRINTQSPLESVSFTGIGASKNNFISEVILQIDQEIQQMDYAVNGQDFNRHIDSLLSLKKEDWIKMNEQNTLSEFAQKVTQAAYIYSYSNRKERYALLRRTKFSKSDSLFFDYRKYLEYNDTDLTYFYPYISYLLNYCTEIALTEDLLYSQSLLPTDFNIRRLDVLDTHINDQNLKNHLARIIALEQLMNNSNSNSNESFLNRYIEVNTSNYYLVEILGVQNNLYQMSRGQNLPTVSLQDTKGNLLDSDSLLGKGPLVIYFWSQTSVSFFNSQLERVRELESKYPKFRFVGICIEPYNELIDEMLQTLEVDTSNQYAFVDFNNASRNWVIQIWNKSIIIDPEGLIVEGFGNLADQQFEELLSGL